MTTRKLNTNPEIYQNLQQMTVSQLIAEMREGKPPASYGDLDYEEMTLMFTDLLEAAYAAQVISLSRRISVLKKVYDAARKALKSCIEHDCLGGKFNGCAHSGKDCTSRDVLKAVQEAEEAL